MTIPKPKQETRPLLPRLRSPTKRNPPKASCVVTENSANEFDGNAPPQVAISDGSGDDLLRCFEQRLQIIRDRVRGVAMGTIHGLYLSGPPGLGKSYTVRESFATSGVIPIVQNGHITPSALFVLLKENPQGHIVLDDVAELFTQKKALQLLLAATDGTATKVRRVSYRTSRGLQSVSFEGTLTSISNLALRNDPIGLALRSRLVIVNHAPSDEEVFSYMRHVAQTKGMGLAGSDQLAVADFIIAECRARDIRPNLRQLERGCGDFKQFKDRKSVTTWQELIRSSMHENGMVRRAPMSRPEKKSAQFEEVHQLLDRFPNDQKQQLEKFTQKRSTFFSVLRQINADAQNKD